MWKRIKQFWAYEISLILAVWPWFISLGNVDLFCSILKLSEERCGSNTFIRAFFTWQGWPTATLYVCIGLILYAERQRNRVVISGLATQSDVNASQKICAEKTSNIHNILDDISKKIIENKSDLDRLHVKMSRMAHFVTRNRLKKRIAEDKRDFDSAYSYFRYTVENSNSGAEIYKEYNKILPCLKN